MNSEAERSSFAFTVYHFSIKGISPKTKSLNLAVSNKMSSLNPPFLIEEAWNREVERIVIKETNSGFNRPYLLCGSKSRFIQALLSIKEHVQMSLHFLAKTLCACLRVIQPLHPPSALSCFSGPSTPLRDLIRSTHEQSCTCWRNPWGQRLQHHSKCV